MAMAMVMISITGFQVANKTIPPSIWELFVPSPLDFDVISRFQLF
jgi:hypothetical protein